VCVCVCVCVCVVWGSIWCGEHERWVSIHVADL
jgi:hypothetical protein